MIFRIIFKISSSNFQEISVTCFLMYSSIYICCKLRGKHSVNFWLRQCIYLYPLLRISSVMFSGNHFLQNCFDEYILYGLRYGFQLVSVIYIPFGVSQVASCHGRFIQFCLANSRNNYPRKETMTPLERARKVTYNGIVFGKIGGIYRGSRLRVTPRLKASTIEMVKI